MFQEPATGPPILFVNQAGAGVEIFLGEKVVTTVLPLLDFLGDELAEEEAEEEAAVKLTVIKLK